MASSSALIRLFTRIFESIASKVVEVKKEVPMIKVVKVKEEEVKAEELNKSGSKEKE